MPQRYTPSYSSEFRDRGVRLYREYRSDYSSYSSDHSAYRAISSKLGCSSDSLHGWCIQAAKDAGERPRAFCI